MLVLNRIPNTNMEREKVPCQKLHIFTLILVLLVANFANTKWCKGPEKMIETLAHGYSSDPMNHDRV